MIPKVAVLEQTAVGLYAPKTQILYSGRRPRMGERHRLPPDFVEIIPDLPDLLRRELGRRSDQRDRRSWCRPGIAHAKHTTNLCDHVGISPAFEPLEKHPATGFDPAAVAHPAAGLRGVVKQPEAIGPTMNGTRDVPPKVVNRQTEFFRRERLEDPEPATFGRRPHCLSVERTPATCW
tara:strand:+ start:2839 stop:3372 length:534 start_codon:yes stop_codon:yes gene_type:complete